MSHQLLCDACFKKLGKKEAYSCSHGYFGGVCANCGLVCYAETDGFRIRNGASMHCVKGPDDHHR